MTVELFEKKITVEERSDLGYVLLLAEFKGYEDFMRFNNNLFGICGNILGTDIYDYNISGFSARFFMPKDFRI